MFGIFSPFGMLFDMVFDLLFGRNRSNGFDIFNFNAYICLIITLIIFIGAPLLFSAVVNYRPAPSFIPVSERHTAAVPQHHKTTSSHPQQSAHHKHKTN